MIKFLKRLRKRNWVIALLCSAAAIIAAAIFLLDSVHKGKDTGDGSFDAIANPEGYADEVLQDHMEANLKIQSDSSTGKSLEFEDRQSEPLAERKSFASAKSALEAHQIIEEAKFKDIEYARDWEFKLANFCGAAQQPPEFISQKPWLLERMKKFCEGYSAPSPESINSIENLMGIKEREYEREFLDSLSSANIDRQSELITNTIVGARFSEQIDAISKLLVDFRSEGLMPWDPLGEDHFESGYFEAEQFALQYFKCMRFSSCGPNSIWFVEMCSYFEPCTEIWTFEDILVNSVTPVQREMGMRIVGHLFERLSEKR